MSYLIAVDSGHGMETAGKRTPAIPEPWFGKKKGEVIHEKEFNRASADYLITALQRCGFKTIDVSPGLKDIPLKDRYTAANNAKADAYISKHYNAHTGKWGKACGIETIISQYASANSKKLAQLVHAELMKAHGGTDRGVKTDIAQSGINIAVLKNTNMPAILTESGFMDNLEEAKRMLDPKFQQADAEAICKGVCKFFNVTYVEPKTETPKQPIAETSKVPNKTITKESSKDDIKWLQAQLNTKLKDNPFVSLTVDGDYGNKTRITLLFYWETLGWNKEGKDDGWKCGAKTITSLSS